jgi:hypothetical protein
MAIEDRAISGHELSLLKISTGRREAGDFREPAVPSRLEPDAASSATGRHALCPRVGIAHGCARPQEAWLNLFGLTHLGNGIAKDTLDALA